LRAEVVGAPPQLEVDLPDSSLIGDSDSRVVEAHGLPVAGVGKPCRERQVEAGGGVAIHADGQRIAELGDAEQPIAALVLDFHPGIARPVDELLNAPGGAVDGREGGQTGERSAFACDRLAER
jgi:hypothetical protein